MLNALQTFADIPDREETDYCAIFGEDDIQGKKHALMTGRFDIGRYRLTNANRWRFKK